MAPSIAAGALILALGLAAALNAQPQQPYDQYGQSNQQPYQPSPSAASLPNNDNDLGANYGLGSGAGLGQGSSYGLGGSGYNSNPYGGGQYGSSALNSLSGDLFDERNFCPEFWVAHQKTCYRFHRSPKRNWHEANRLCKAMNAVLLNADSVDKHSFVLRELIVQDQRQNRYYVSAHQTQSGNWINEDQSALVQLADDTGIAYDEASDLDEDTLIENLNERRGWRGGVGGLNAAGDPNRLGGSSRNDNPLLSGTDRNFGTSGSGFGTSGLTDYQRQQQQRRDRTRLVYGYSPLKDRWLLIPSYEFEQHLFICESQQLYSAANLNALQDDKRTYDYGVEITDERRIPRGPYFVRQPIDTTFDTSKRLITNWVTISCLARGYPTPDYEWFKEEYVNANLTYYPIDPLVESRYTTSGGNLIVHDPDQNRDQGTYHCVARNQYGAIRSESVQLNFGYIMEFNLKRSEEVGDTNWGKALFCDPPQHYPAVKYYWSREYFPNFVDEDQRVFVSNDGALYFSALEQIDRANYSCTVQSTSSRNGRNGPFFPLKVRQHPNYMDLVFANSFPKIFPKAPQAGAEVRLECVAFGYPVPSYNWTRRAGGLPRHAYQINYNRVLIIPNATLNDNGEYVCTTHNGRKTAIKSVVLNVQMRPNFTIPLRDKIRDLHADVSFVCEANAIPDVNYTWYKNAQLLDPNSGQLDRDRFVVQDNLLTIKRLDPERDDGMYQCCARNQLGAVYSSAQLRVLSMKPSFHKRPLESEIYAIYNGNTTIVCDPEAAPRPKFQWKKDGMLIGAGGHRRILPTGTLVIAPTSRDDEGVYTCVASNTYGSDESRARVIVLQELRFIQPLPQAVYHQIGELLYLHCDVTYDEVLDVAFVWRHNGQLVQEKMNQRFIVNTNSLEVHNLTLLDAGDYECIAKSAVNEIATRTAVTIAGPPGAPGGVKVIDIQRTTARLEWIDGTPNGRPIQYYNVLGRTAWNRTWVNVTEAVNAVPISRYTGRKEAEITGLTPWSAYEFAVTAVNDLGVGAQSAPSPQFKTHTDRPYRAPRDVSGGGGKIGDLTIRWQPLQPSEQNAAGIRYKIFWRLHAKDTEWATEMLADTGNVGMAVVPVPAGNYYTRYDVKVQAYNEVGAGPESRVAVVHSAEEMPTVVPQQPIARGFNSTCLNVTWNAVEQTREKIRGNLIGHRLKYWKKDLAEEDAVYYLSRTTRPWALIVGLEPDTYYFVKVMAYNAAGEGPESERYLERTFRKAPQKPPSSVNVYGINPSTVRVVWRYVGVTLEEEPIQGYKVRVWETDQDMSRANDTYVYIGNKLEAYVPDLTPGKSYKMRVLAFSNGGDGRMSSPELSFQMGNTQARNGAHETRMRHSVWLGMAIVLYLLQMTVY